MSNAGIYGVSMDLSIRQEFDSGNAEPHNAMHKTFKRPARRAPEMH